MTESDLERTPLIHGLFDVLPSPGATWPTAARAKWLRAAVTMFDYTYIGDDDATITVTIQGGHSGPAVEPQEVDATGEVVVRPLR